MGGCLAMLGGRTLSLSGLRDMARCSRNSAGPTNHAEGVFLLRLGGRLLESRHSALGTAIRGRDGNIVHT